jgi:hypothetical protein
MHSVYNNVKFLGVRQSKIVNPYKIKYIAYIVTNF